MLNLWTKKRPAERRFKRTPKARATTSPGYNNAATSMDRLDPRAQYLVSFLFG
jgi:hypothetical protein